MTNDYMTDFYNRMISFDPGNATGVAVIRWHDGTRVAECLHRETYVYDESRNFQAFVGGIIGEYSGELKEGGHTSFVCERLPDFKLVNQKAKKISIECLEIIKELFEIFKKDQRLFNVYSIGPGEWKPVAGKISLPFRPSTQHEKDAYRLGRFAMFKNFGVPL